MSARIDAGGKRAGRMTMRRLLQTGLAAAALLACALAGAVLPTAEPYQLVQQTTERVLKIVTDARDYYEAEPQRFHRQIEEVMDQTVDFDGFARGVMGRYASAQRYQALKSEAEKAAFRAQVARFTDSFKRGLIQTYAKGLLRFDGNRIQTFPGKPAAGGAVSVMQHIHGNAEKPYIVQYTLRQDRRGDWKVRNVMIEGINFGQTYRNQFMAAVEQHKGDIDKVIDNWHVEPEAVAAARRAAEAEAEK
jgi:phospholipid transport system substrate-binding protein